MAPSTPPPPSRLSLAALTMASTSRSVMSPSTTSTMRASSRNSLAEDAQDGPHQGILLRPGELFQFARVEPGAVAGEAAVHLHVAEADFLELHAALGAAHVVLLAQRLALGAGQPRSLLGGELAQALRVLAGEVLFFGVARLVRHEASDTDRVLLCAAISRRNVARGNADIRRGSVMGQ